MFLVLRRRYSFLWLGTVLALVESTPIPRFLLTAIRDGFVLLQDATYPLRFRDTDNRIGIARSAPVLAIATDSGPCFFSF
jgi:hypothetical protein